MNKENEVSKKNLNQDSLKIFVTGGAGFIGANFVRYWLEHYPKDQVTVYDKMTYAASIERLPLQEPNLAIIEGDICNFDQTLKSIQNSDVVVHFAAETHVDRSLAGLEAEKEFFKSNVEGTQTLLYAADKAGVKRFHHISTDEVFGDLNFDDQETFHEKFPYNPHNPYSISKAASDFVVKSFGKNYQLPFTISNCTNNYGPYQTPEKMIPRSISLLLSGKKIKLYTDPEGNAGRNIRDWLHVSDHCRAIDFILRYGQLGETYGVGGENEISNYELVGIILHHISELTGESLSIEKNVEFVKDRPGHDKRYAMNIGKIGRELGWKPLVNFSEGIRQTIEWYLSQEGRNWLASLASTSEDVRKNQSRSV